MSVEAVTNIRSSLKGAGRDPGTATTLWAESDCAGGRLPAKQTCWQLRAWLPTALESDRNLEIGKPELGPDQQVKGTAV